MMYSQSPQQIAQELIKSSAILLPGKFLQKLQQYDKETIEWQKSQLQDKFVSQIRKDHKTYNNYTEHIRNNNANFKNEKQSQLFFTNMIQLVDQKAYHYKKHDYQSIKNQLQLTGKMINHLVHPNSQIKKTQGNEQQWKIEQNRGQQFIPQTNNLRNSSKSSAKQQFTSFQGVPPSRTYAPFLNSNENPYDRHANSKLLKNKFGHMSYNTSMRNVAAMVENDKRQYEPNIVNEMLQNNQARKTYSAYKDNKRSNLVQKSINNTTVNDRNLGMSLNIGDVLKYTLGEKRDRQRNIKAEPIKNPFVRVPIKYSESLGDFYKAN